MNIKIAETTIEKRHACSIRTMVFVDEQKVSPRDELDTYDNGAIHFIGYQDDIPIAASRLRWVGAFGKLERICVVKNHRRKSYGKQLIQAMEAEIVKNGYPKAKLNSQTHAVSFYKNLGYNTISSEFLDAGIPHITMVKQLKEIAIK